MNIYAQILSISILQSGSVISIEEIVTIDVDVTYNRLISLLLYPRIFAMEMGNAFFSIIIFDNK